ncbi:optic atrophy 3 protein-domain-containing protein [Cokeromyces recurvatus]|uniref:optic atrophy 3 protein-domain-containing protein n=1 Tax=Cokeromyces recurvatus TaxID=90255 RepID=UPI002220437B|nr:optic atrophy 3 protein-domain-containing protein [Cokeromyces recurvatus]KAI7903614.1 optic atrophy 3 protein-domain-containing protein [Cokeromyces recurvatus]
MSTIKIASLLVKTLAKPVANSIKTQAKQHPKFKEFCINVAQGSHTLEMTLKMKFLGYKKEKIRPLNDARAIESGANFLSEAFVFAVAASVIIAESWRSRATAKNRRNYVDDALENLENRTKTLTELFEEARELNHTNEARLKQIEEDNVHLRKILDEILSVSMGLKRHTEYQQQPTIIQLPGISGEGL